MNKDDYELVDGFHECEGCCFLTENFRCKVDICSCYYNDFKGCHEDVGVWLDEDYPDPDEGIYLIWAKK